MAEECEIMPNPPNFSKHITCQIKYLKKKIRYIAKLESNHWNYPNSKNKLESHKP